LEFIDLATGLAMGTRRVRNKKLATQTRALFKELQVHFNVLPDNRLGPVWFSFAAHVTKYDEEISFHGMTRDATTKPSTHLEQKPASVFHQGISPLHQNGHKELKKRVLDGLNKARADGNRGCFFLVLRQPISFRIGA
jgi:hypothetical protein